jgi:hypothetical protein
LGDTGNLHLFTTKTTALARHLIYRLGGKKDDTHCTKQPNYLFCCRLGSGSNDVLGACTPSALTVLDVMCSHLEQCTVTRIFDSARELFV